MAPATGRSYRFSARRQVPAYPAYRRQAQAGRRAQRQINIVKLTHYRPAAVQDRVTATMHLSVRVRPVAGATGLDAREYA